MDNQSIAYIPNPKSMIHSFESKLVETLIKQKLTHSDDPDAAISQLVGYLSCLADLGAISRDEVNMETRKFYQLIIKMYPNTLSDRPREE
ncbi:MAG: hypothetical protein J6P72_01990 [Firmicutes bacterium]|nr:hypothetical protein [Bacillota bacterium]